MSGPPAGWVLYDADCALCVRWMTRLRGPIGRRGFEIAPLQAPWVADRLGLSGPALVEDIRLLAADGRVISGAAVYRHLARRIWWAWGFWALSALSGLDWLVHRFYRWVAASRRCGGLACSVRSP